MITQTGENLKIEFAPPFGIEKYDLFLRAKKLPESRLVYDWTTDIYSIETHSRYASMLGINETAALSAEAEISSFLFEHQREIVKLAVAAKRYAVWANVGLGKTLIELEFAKQVNHITGGRVLILTLNEIVNQTIEECAKFYGTDLKVLRLESREELRQWCKGKFEPEYKIAITNYEKMNPDEQGQEVAELKNLAGIVLDESSRLKAGGGKQKWAIIKSSRGIPYKLSATATPAPNDYVLIFQKGGECANPVKALYDKDINPSGWVTSDEWIRDASGIWKDINEIDVLDGYRAARESDEEKHVCPLQLTVIRRLIKLYANPISIQTDVRVLDPFIGIGSTAFVAVEQDRNAVGFELKESYFDQAQRNVRIAFENKKQADNSLFATV